MQIVKKVEEIRQLACSWKESRQKIAVVPTMGCLHAGHLSLMRLARKHGDRVVVTLFVNPLQFGPNEDFAAYPRQLHQDCLLAQGEGVDVVFAPEAEELYPQDFQTEVRVGELAQGMCGASRPGHFDGVATVVTKLLLLTLADAAVFGEKDFQQLAIIRRLVADLHVPVHIIGAPIVREDDGLAMSSRNKYLQPEMRPAALSLSRSICLAQKMVAEAGVPLAAEVVLAEVRRLIEDAGGQLDYAVIVDERTLRETSPVDRHSRLALAVRIGGVVRLIDNARLMPAAS